MEEFKPIAETLLKTTKGQWVTYPRGSDHKPLVKSIEEYGTGWCLRGEEMAKRYLVRDDNELQVYYSNDAEGNPTVPRVVMVINSNNEIDEVRGVERGENLDPYIGDVVQTKLDEHPDGKAFAKKSADMKRLTGIDRKVKAGDELSKDDLIFLYEINDPIEGFGYWSEDDPRIKKIRTGRNPQDDAPIVFDCRPDQIAWKKEDIRSDTKMYIGPIFPGIFDQLRHVDDIFTAFPEVKIIRETLEIGEKTGKELYSELDAQRVVMDTPAQKILQSRNFPTIIKPEAIHLVRLYIRNLGFTGSPTYDELKSRVQEYGLEFVPPETGAYYRLAHMDQPVGEIIVMGMDLIPPSVRNKNAFRVTRPGDTRVLDYYDHSFFHPDEKIILRYRPSSKIQNNEGEAS